MFYRPNLKDIAKELAAEMIQGHAPPSQTIVPALALFMCFLGAVEETNLRQFSASHSSTVIQ